MNVMLAFIGHTEILVILGIVVLLFGATKLPKLGSAVGQTIKNFKHGMREAREEEEKEQAKLEDKSDEKSEEKSDSEKK